MKKLIGLILLFSFAAQAQFQKGYIKKNGKFVNGHLKTKPNKTTLDNYLLPNKVDKKQRLKKCKTLHTICIRSADINTL